MFNHLGLQGDDATLVDPYATEFAQTSVINTNLGIRQNNLITAINTILIKMRINPIQI